MKNNVNPTADERMAIIAVASNLFRQRFYSPDLDGLDLDAALAGTKTDLLSTKAFSSELTAVFARCGARPIEVFHGSERQLPLSRFLKATLFKHENGNVVFRDVLIGGRARGLDIQPGDRLLKLNGAIPASEDARVPANTDMDLSVEGKNGATRRITFGPPLSYKPRPERNVESRKLDGDVGHLRIASWPGILGIEVAKETDAAIRALNCKRLIVDLRGNFGSVGAGNLRLMSYFTPEKVPVGYSLTRRRAEEGYNRDALPQFKRIPKFKLEGLPILWKFRKLDRSIVVVTEGLGRQDFHGQIVVLVNRHTISGAEIVVQFAKQHGLALIVGERTAGHSLSFATFELPHGFRFTFPIGNYISWSGDRFENSGVKPDLDCSYVPSSQTSEDSELEFASQVARGNAAIKHHIGG